MSEVWRAGMAYDSVINVIVDCPVGRRGLHQAPMNLASRGYPTRVAPRAATAVRPPPLFEQRLDDRPLVDQVHARRVRRVDRNRL